MPDRNLSETQRDVTTDRRRLHRTLTTRRLASTHRYRDSRIQEAASPRVRTLRAGLLGTSVSYVVLRHLVFDGRVLTTVRGDGTGSA